jgi:ATP-dependent RNA helicase DeaD
MLDMGFRDDIELILQGVPKERQTVFFSATMPRPIQELIRKYSRDPQNVRMEQKELTVPTVEQVYYEVDRRFKIDLLTRLIDLHDLKLGIIFCNTKRMVDDLVDHLNAQGYSADRLHGDMTQPMRDRVMNKFRKSGLEFLVATDVAARGIDVENVQVVFNYDLPYDVEDYLHRIGRTGRAGKAGRAISFAAGRELFQIQQIERYTRVKMQRGKPPTTGEVEEARTHVVLEKLRATLQAKEFKRQDHLIERLLEEGFTSTDIASALLHQLQAGEAAPITSLVAPIREDRTREVRPTFRERRFGRDERGSNGRDSDRPSGPSRKPWRSAQGEGEPRIAPRSSSQSEPGKVARVIHPTAAGAPARVGTRTPDEQTRLYMNVGEKMGVAAADVTGAILGETGLPAKVVGRVDIRERHLFVDVAAEHANSIISKLNRTSIKNQKLKVKVA